MSKRSSVCLLFFLLASSDCFAQQKINPKKFVGRSFWTKFVLATDSECRIEIAPDDLSPGQENCRFVAFLETNSKVKLKKLSFIKGWAKLIFQSGGDDFEIFLKHDSKSHFNKSFNLAFSSKTLPEDDAFANCRLENKNKIDVIKQMGFPSEIKRTGTTEIWVFGIGWGGGYPCGFDITDIEIKDNKVTNVGGII